METLFSLFLLIFLNPVSPLRAFLRPRAYPSGNLPAKFSTSCRTVFLGNPRRCGGGGPAGHLEPAWLRLSPSCQALRPGTGAGVLCYRRGNSYRPPQPGLCTSPPLLLNSQCTRNKDIPCLDFKYIIPCQEVVRPRHCEEHHKTRHCERSEAIYTRTSKQDCRGRCCGLAMTFLRHCERSEAI